MRVVTVSEIDPYRACIKHNIEMLKIAAGFVPSDGK